MGTPLLIGHATEPPGVEHLGGPQCLCCLRSTSNRPWDRRNGPARVIAPDLHNRIDLGIIEQQR
jgi:hypothetical protein